MKSKNETTKIMKRTSLLLLFVASIMACNKIEQKDSEKAPFVFKATMENTVSKAAVSDGETVWASDDRVGLFVYKPSTWEDGGTTYLTLSNGAGSSEAEFGTWPTGYNNAGMQWDYVAFYPYQRISGEDGATTVNNTYFTKNTSTLSVEYPDSYYCYASGQSYVPLIANLAKTGETNPSQMDFKHIGGAVKLSLSNVPGTFKSIGMTVDRGITGSFDVLPAEAGNTGGTAVATTGTNSSVWINRTPTSEVSDIDFIFPVPTMSSPSLSFVAYDQNGLVIWSKTASKQPDIERATLLKLEKNFVAKLGNNFYLRGYINGADVKDNSIAFDANGEISSIAFASDSYLYLVVNVTNDYPCVPSASVSDADNADCWKWNSWDSFNESNCPKLKVAAGTYKLNLSYNPNGSINLKYTAL